MPSIGRKGFKWTTSDASNPALALVVDNDSKSVHIVDAENVETDWNVTDSDPALYIHSNDTPKTEYTKLYNDATNAYLTVVGTAGLDIGVPTDQTIGLQINATDVLTLTSTYLTINDADIQIGDTDYLCFGDGTSGDVSMSWDATGFFMTSLAAASGWNIGGASKVFNITHHGTFTNGMDGTAYDQIWYADATGCSLLWDSSEEALAFRHDGTAGGRIYTDTTENHWLDIQAFDVDATAYASVIKIVNDATNVELGFFDTTPVAQPSAIADSTDPTTCEQRLNEVITALEVLGLIAAT